MIKKLFYIFILFIITSCELLGLQQKELNQEKPIASVFDEHLYRKDIKDLIPKNMNEKDSLVLVKSVINNWAKQQLLLKKASDNLSEDFTTEYQDLVKKYRESLLINGYKEQLIKQQLDTIIAEEEITTFYNDNKENFKLNEELVKLKYIYLDSSFSNPKEIKDLFISEDEEAKEQLEEQELNFTASYLNDSTWVSLENVLLKNPRFKQIDKENLLKKSKLIQKEDSLGLYLVAVKNVLKRNDIAPLNYITPTIKQMILHKRKLELIREIEKTIINDAIQNKSFKEY